MISKIQTVQLWLSQFSKSDRDVAESLLDNLIFINTSSVIYDLLENIFQNNKGYIVALLPIRELESGENIYDISNKSIHPNLQLSNEPLGSEAFISNLYTQLNRKDKEQFPLFGSGKKRNCHPPSLDEMKKSKIKKLILIDDLIGSGDRAVSFINNIRSHPTIKSRLSSGYLEIEILAYMATDIGMSIVKRYISRKKGLSLNVLYKTPLISEVDNCKEIINLCESYAHRKENSPLGYKNSAVRVIFSHSAPNNIPAILYRNTKKYKPACQNITHINSWDALFPNRYVPTEFINEIKTKNKNKDKFSRMIDVLQLLKIAELDIKRISKHTDMAQYMLIPILRNMEKANWVTKKNNIFNITALGEQELIHIKNNEKKPIGILKKK